MLLYLRTSKGDINTQNTGGRVGETVDGSKYNYRWAFPDSLEPYEIRRAQVEELGNDVGNMLLAVKVREDDDKKTDLHIGIDGSFYQHGQRVLDVSDINNIVASAVAKLTSTCPFPVGTAFLIAGNEKRNWFGQNNSGYDNANTMVNLLQNQYSGTTWEAYEAKETFSGIYGGTIYLYGVRRTA